MCKHKTPNNHSRIGVDQLSVQASITDPIPITKQKSSKKLNMLTLARCGVGPPSVILKQICNHAETVTFDLVSFLIVSYPQIVDSI